MDKTDLKKLLKPLIKEAVKEVLLEQGLIALLKESLEVQPTPQETKVAKNPLQEDLQVKKIQEAQENRKKMLKEIASSGYVNSGFNPFANTTAIPGGSDHLNEVKIDPRGPLKDIDPNDPGVDISAFMGNKAVWSAVAKTKGK